MICCGLSYKDENSIRDEKSNKLIKYEYVVISFRLRALLMMTTLKGKTALWWDGGLCHQVCIAREKEREREREIERVFFVNVWVGVWGGVRVYVYGCVWVGVCSCVCVWVWVNTSFIILFATLCVWVFFSRCVTPGGRV